MKGNQEVIDALNGLLSGELAAVNQYMVHSEMSANWGYEKLHNHFEKRAIDEMKHAETLIGRILFLEGLPIVSKLDPIHIGSDIPKQLASDHAAEEGAIRDYNAAITLAGEKKGFRHPGDPRRHSQRRRQAHRRHRGAAGSDRTDVHTNLSLHKGVSHPKGQDKSKPPITAAFCMLKHDPL